MLSSRILFGETDCKKIVAHSVLEVIRVKPDHWDFLLTLMLPSGVADFTSISSVRPRGLGQSPAGGQGQANQRETSIALSSIIIVLWSMPRKIRELIKDLKKAGFVNRGGKGSHKNFLHSTGIVITISGKTGDDAKPYQEKQLKEALKKVSK